MLCIHNMTVISFYFYLLVLVLNTSESFGDNWDEYIRGRTWEELFTGDQALLVSSKPLSQKRASEFKVNDCPEKYDINLEIMWVQDTTGSFNYFLNRTSEKFSDMVGTFQRYYKSTKFGLVEFRDKPVTPHGFPSDFCYRLRTGYVRCR